MAGNLFKAKPLSETMLDYYRLDPLFQPQYVNDETYIPTWAVISKGFDDILLSYAENTKIHFLWPSWQVGKMGLVILQTSKFSRASIH